MFESCCSVAKSCLTFCNPVDGSMPGFPVLQHLLEFAQTHVHWISDAISFSVVLFSSHLQSFPASGSLLTSWFCTLGSQSIGASASASVLPMSIQDWSPLGWTCLISLQSKGLSRVFSNSTDQKHPFLWQCICFMVQLSHPYMITGKTVTRTFVRKVNVSAV